MPSIVITMLADVDTTAVTDFLKDHKLILNERNYENVDEAAGAITKDTGAVLVNERACKKTLGGRKEVIEKLRAADPDVRIVFCLDKAGEEKEFQEYCRIHRVTDLFYPDRKGYVKLDEIAKALSKGRIKEGSGEKNAEKSGLFSRQQKSSKPPPDKTPSAPVERVVEKIVEVPVERIVEKVVEVPVERVVEKVVEVPVERVVEKIVEVPIGKPEEIIVEKIVEVPVEVVKTVDRIVEVQVDRLIQDAPGRMIGIFNVSRGAGASWTAQEIASEAARRGVSTYLVGADGTDDYRYAKKEKKLKIRYDEDALDEALMSVLTGETKLVVVDFGLLLDINGKGEMYGGLEERKKTFDRLAKCSALYGMCFSSPWHFTKVKHLQKLLELYQPVFISDQKESKGIASREELPPYVIADRLFTSQANERIS